MSPSLRINNNKTVINNNKYLGSLPVIKYTMAKEPTYERPPFPKKLGNVSIAIHLTWTDLAKPVDRPSMKKLPKA